jgi:hypothetical protein
VCPAPESGRSSGSTVPPRTWPTYYGPVSPRCPRTAINSQRPPPEATCEHEARRPLNPRATHQNTLVMRSSPATKGSHAGSHTNEQPSVAPDSAGQPKKRSRRSRTGPDSTGRRYGHLRIRRFMGVLLAARLSRPSPPSQGQAARGRFASLDTATAARGTAAIEEDGGGPGHGNQRRPNRDPLGH